MKIRIAMIDSDQEYVSRFFKCINDKYSDKIELHIFSKLELFYNNINKIKYEVILLNKQYLGNNNLQQKDNIIIYLVDKLIVNNNLKFIKKYQRISNIYNEILSFYSEKFILEVKESKVNLNTNLITFLSYESSSGSSIHALLFSKFLVKSNKKVLMIDLKNIPSISYYIKPDSKFCLSDILYSIKSKNSDILGKIKCSIQSDKTGIDFISPCKNLLERSEATRDDIEVLICSLIKLKVYDYIVLGINYMVDDVCKYLLDKSNKICLTFQNSELTIHKISQVIDSIKIIQSDINKDYLIKINLIENKCENKNIDNCVFKDINIIGKCRFYEKPVYKNMINDLNNMLFYKKLI